MANREENNTSQKMPGYDGRLVYFKSVDRSMVLITQSQVTKNYILWYNALCQLHSLFNPLLSLENREDIKERLSKVMTQIYSLGRLNGNVKWVEERNVESKLNTITTDLYSYGAHILLPLGHDEETADDDFL